jgi:hypothetical protein
VHVPPGAITGEGTWVSAVWTFEAPAAGSERMQHAQPLVGPTSTSHASPTLAQPGVPGQHLLVQSASMASKASAAKSITGMRRSQPRRMTRQLYDRHLIRPTTTGARGLATERAGVPWGFGSLPAPLLRAHPAGRGNTLNPAPSPAELSAARAKRAASTVARGPLSPLPSRRAPHSRRPSTCSRGA